MNSGYSKILIFYFSGTGHTEYLCKKIKDEFEKNGIAVTLKDVTGKSDCDVDIEDFDLIGFAYPVHAFNPPENFFKFVKDLRIKDKPYFITKNSREALCFNDASSRLLIKNLKRKGCHLVGEKHFLTPYNIHYKNDVRLVKQMLSVLPEKIEEFVLDISNGRVKTIKWNLFTVTVSWAFRIEWWGARVIGKRLRIKDNCVSCYRCVNNCPSKNVSIKDGKIQFGKDCMLCMRCVMNCPVNAIYMTLLKGWEVNGRYDFEKILNDSTISKDFINSKSKGVLARSYKKYFGVK